MNDYKTAFRFMIIIVLVIRRTIFRFFEGLLKAYGFDNDKNTKN